MRILYLALFSLIGSFTFAQTGTISGKITDAKTGEDIIGANVSIQGTQVGAATDLEGKFSIANLKPGTYSIVVSFITYKTQTIPDVVVASEKITTLNISLQEDATELEEIVVTAVRETSTDVNLLKAIKDNKLVVSGISAQTISRSLDSDAAQVVKRIPGVTIIQDRFIVIRGLNERYNATMLHNAYAPSMESDTRSFSFDLIPSNIIDQVLIFKSPAPELPGDFSGGAVKIFTKGIPDENSTIIDMGIGYRSGTSLKSFYAEERRSGHWMGFNDGANDLPAGFPSNFNGLSNDQINAAGRSLPNNWKEQKYNAGLDSKFSITHNFRKDIGKLQIGNVTSVNYSNSKTIFNIENISYEAYDFTTNSEKQRFNYGDTQYSQEILAGLVHNWAVRLSSNHFLEFKNLYNQLSSYRFVDRFGDQFAQSFVFDNSAFYNEYRGFYSGQLVGTHKLFNETTLIEWVGGYGKSFNDLPDYRRFRRNVYDRENRLSTLFIPIPQSPDFFGKFYSEMEEDVYTGSITVDQKIKFKNAESFNPSVKFGAFYEDKERVFDARNLGFVQGFNFDSDLIALPVEELFAGEGNININGGIRVNENFNPTNSYVASNRLFATFLSLNIPIGRFNISGGVRVENNVQQLKSATTTGPILVDNPIVSWLPSGTISYSISDKMAIKAVAGKTLNRPEFREIAPFSFYDFIFDATISGNVFLENSSVTNVDLRWELYPSATETITVALFYKDFNSPIEKLFTAFGSEQPTFQFINLESAYSRGIEIDARKSLSAIPSAFLNKLSVLVNVALIQSRVTLGEEASQLAEAKDRPLQGQSPYIVNTGLFYNDDDKSFQVNLMYNVIGQRIFAVGGSFIPDTYEMPRNQLDLSIRKGIGERFTLKAGIRDILSQDFLLLQDGNEDGKLDRKNDQAIRRFNPGRSFSLGVSIKL